jgi:hypothetical protein
MAGGSYSALTPPAAGNIITRQIGLDIRDSVNLRFASAAARDATLTGLAAGDEGLRCLLQDTGQWCWYTGSAWYLDPGTVIARHRRTTNSSTTTSEVGVIRLDDIAVASGQALVVWSPPLAMTSGTSDEVVVRYRYTTDGSTPSTSSAIMPGAESTMRLPNVSYEESMVMQALYIPASAETLSILMTVARITGTGASGILSSSENPIEMIIQAAGTDPGSTGTNI